MDFITSSDKIDGVQIARPRVFADERGAFMEIFRHEWFPQVSWDKLQSNRSVSNVAKSSLGQKCHQVFVRLAMLQSYRSLIDATKLSFG